jgi:hypothetical protein
MNRVCHTCGERGSLCLFGAWWCLGHADRFRAYRLAKLARIMHHRIHAASLLRKVA